jgi:pimeloyl-ACP methyl ester carboxylesterase
MLPLQEAKIEIERRGRGKPLLLLHGEDTYEPTLPLIDELARRFEVIMPWMPGYGRSTLPESVHGIEDISYLWLDLLDRLNLKNVAVMGFSVGGWAAAEMATKNCGRLSRLVLVDPVGAKFGGPFDRDIADIYFNSFDKVRAMKFADPAKDPRDLTRLADDEAFRVARDREITAKLCWEPYFHNPSLKYRLNRIGVPTLVIWGAKDGIVSPAYGRAYAKRIKGAKFVAIPKAGHLPHVEQPEAFRRALAGFLR